jgi:hypothetical protein
MDRAGSNHVAVTAPRQGEMPVFAVFVGTILTERLIGSAESVVSRPA